MTTENERMATVETELKQINKLLMKLDEKFDNMNTQYVPRSEIDEKFKSRDEKVILIQADILSMKANQQTNKSIYPAWAAVIVAILATVMAIIY